MRSKIWLKSIRNVVKSQKFPSLYYEIDVSEDDGDDRIRTGSTSNGVYAHAHKEMVKNGCKWFPIVEIFDSYIIYTSLFIIRMVENKHGKNGKHNTIKRTK